MQTRSEKRAAGAWAARAALRAAAGVLIAAIRASGADAPGLVIPPGSGVVNVRDYGAAGDGVRDDTEAIGRAISENIDRNRYRASPFVYLPDGTYLVSGPIESRLRHPDLAAGKVWSAGWRAGLVLAGQSRTGTVIRLKDSAPGYGDPAKPKWVVATGSESDDRSNFAGGGNRAFRHGIVNLTVDVGAGNPGAVAVDFVVSNRGTIDGVTLRAAPGSGHTGIGLTRSWPGPAIVLDVAIEGFDTGIALDHYQYGMTFENLRLRGQRRIGVRNTRNVVAMRRVDFEGSVPFYASDKPHGLLCLLDSELRGTGAASGLAAISCGGMLNLRRVAVSGFGKALDDLTKADGDLPAGPAATNVVARHDQGFALDAAGGAPAPLDLPIEDIPEVRAPRGAAWTDGGTNGASLQAAIDAGAEWIFVRPVQKVALGDTLVLRGKTRLILGLNGHLAGPGGGRPAVRVADGEAPVVAMEHLYIEGGIEQASGRTFVLRHGDLGGAGLKATGPGRTHVVDVIGKGYDIGPRHRFWGRQLNAEFGDEPLFVNRGTSWILGFKMESSTRGDKAGSHGTPVLWNRGGEFEMFGGLLYTLGSRREQAPDVPAFTNEKGRLAVSYRVNGRPETYYARILRAGDLASGRDAVTAGQIRGPGAALLTDTR